MQVLVSSVILIIIIIILYVARSRLLLPPKYRGISSHVPSVTKSLWSEFLVSIELANTPQKDTMSFATNLFRNNGPVVHLSVAGRSFVLINDPDDIKILLSSTLHIDKSHEYEMMKPWLKEGLLTSSGKKWQNRRKLLTQTFHFKSLRLYNEQINRHARVMMENLLKASAAVADGGIDIVQHVSLCSLDIICETIMGTELNTQQGESVQYIYAIKNACKSLVDRILKFWLWNDLIFQMSATGWTFYKSIKVLQEYTNNVIKYKRKLMNVSKNEKEICESENVSEKMQTKSLLDLLLHVSSENPEQMTDEDICEEVDTFLFEGHDTTSVALSMILTMLATHPNVQTKARNEIRDIFGHSDRYASMEDIKAMQYLEAIIKESLRLYPSVPVISRKLHTTLKLTNYTIPPMTTMVVLPYILHRTRDIYPNPEEFIPERFLDEENKSKYLFGYLPFSAGPRNCIGQKYAMNQMKTVVSTVLRKSSIEALGSKEDIRIVPQLVTRIESLPKMKFHKR